VEEELTRMLRLATGVVVVGFSAAVVALAPAATPTERHYVAALKTEYLPLQRAFTASLRPCFFSRDMALCRKSAPTAQTRAQRVLRLLARTTPPRRLGTADRNLEHGVRALANAYTPLMAAIAAADNAAFGTSLVRLDKAARAVNTAINQINALVPSALLPNLPL
jgi:hypothetical protein